MVVLQEWFVIKMVFMSVSSKCSFTRNICNRGILQEMLVMMMAWHETIAIMMVLQETTVTNVLQKKSESKFFLQHNIIIVFGLTEKKVMTVLQEAFAIMKQL